MHTSPQSSSYNAFSITNFTESESHNLMMSETPARDLADPSAAAVAVPSHALNIKGRISKHPNKTIEGERERNGGDFYSSRRCIPLFTNPSLNLWYGSCDLCRSAEGQRLIFNCGFVGMSTE